MGVRNGKFPKKETQLLDYINILLIPELKNIGWIGPDGVILLLAVSGALEAEVVPWDGAGIDRWNASLSDLRELGYEKTTN